MSASSSSIGPPQSRSSSSQIALAETCRANRSRASSTGTASATRPPKASMVRVARSIASSLLAPIRMGGFVE
jgi:hypothetical protein